VYLIKKKSRSERRKRNEEKVDKLK
jgi:hypothetical protein